MGFTEGGRGEGESYTRHSEPKIIPDLVLKGANSGKNR